MIELFEYFTLCGCFRIPQEIPDCYFPRGSNRVFFHANNALYAKELFRWNGNYDFETGIYSINYDNMVDVLNILNANGTKVIIKIKT